MLIMYILFTIVTIFFHLEVMLFKVLITTRRKGKLNRLLKDCRLCIVVSRWRVVCYILFHVLLTWLFSGCILPIWWPQLPTSSTYNLILSKCILMVEARYWKCSGCSLQSWYGKDRSNDFKPSFISKGENCEILIIMHIKNEFFPLFRECWLLTIIYLHFLHTEFYLHFLAVLPNSWGVHQLFQQKKMPRWEGSSSPKSDC